MIFSKLSFRSVSLAVVGILLVALPAMAAIDGYITMKGKRSHVIDVRQAIVSPRDAQSGQASGRRQHQPITIVKEVDAASPLYKEAYEKHEALGTVVIEFTPREKSPEKVTLTDAVITEIKFVPRHGAEGEEEEITLTYRQIEWTLKGGRTSTDDWTQ